MADRSPGPRCQARMGYVAHAPTRPGLLPVVEHRSARCFLEHGHPGDHRATIPPPRAGEALTRSARGRVVAFRNEHIR